MNNIWYKVIISSLLLMLILVPFAGLAPLLLLILVANIYWLFSSIIQTLIFGNTDQSDFSDPKRLSDWLCPHSRVNHRAERDRDTANN